MSENKYLTVSLLNEYVKSLITNDFLLKNIYLKGEISNFKHHSRGHFYFTLKDELSQISCVMFSSYSSRVKFIPKDGMTVLVSGYLSVYEANGTYQIYVNSMEEMGLGNLYLKYEKLKNDLEQKGYFLKERKKSLPRFPKVIGIATSPTGAAIKDMVNIISRRYPIVKIKIFPTLVQGEEAKYSIVNSIKRANEEKDIDVLIIGRGGGSIEDLWAFNEEIVADAIYSSRVPIISAVGHETDFTISDFVADLRAETPSGAAEKVVPNIQDLYFELNHYEKNLHDIMDKILKFQMEKVSNLENSYIFSNPYRLLEKHLSRLTELDTRLDKYNPLNRLETLENGLLNLDTNLNKEYKRILVEKQNSFVNYLTFI